MNGQSFKHLVNVELDIVAMRELGRVPTHEERYVWWTTPQGGVEDPAMLVVVGSDEDRDAVVKAAREWQP